MSVFIAPLHQFDWWQAKGKINIKRNVILSKNGVIKGVSWRKRDKKTKGNRRAEFSDALTRNGTRCIMRSARSRWGEQREKSRLRETTTFRLPCRKSSWKGRKKKKTTKSAKPISFTFFAPCIIISWSRTNLLFLSWCCCVDLVLCIYSLCIQSELSLEIDLHQSVVKGGIQWS